MISPSRPFRRFALVALVCAASLAGCDESKVLGPVKEEEDSNFLEGKRLAGEGKDREALESFTKVILARRDAPESHLEAGNLCLDTKVKDPLLAIFHFRRYLAVRPESAPLINQRIRAAEKEFLKTLSFVPPDGSAGDRVAGLQDQLKLVRAENDKLKQQVQSLSVAANRPAPTPVRPLTPPDDDSTPVATVKTPTPTASDTPAAPPAKRTHAISKGETLTSISRKYYGTPTKWMIIYNANRNVMRNEQDLKIGKVLVIPE